jgi:hypothetical protein
MRFDILFLAVAGRLITEASVWPARQRETRTRRAVSRRGRFSRLRAFGAYISGAASPLSQMSRTKKPLHDRVAEAAEKALAAQGFVSSIDVLVGIGWVPPSVAESWRRGQIECLEAAMQVDPSRITQALRLLRSWAEERDLTASPTDYIARTPQR